MDEANNAQFGNETQPADTSIDAVETADTIAKRILIESNLLFERWCRTWGEGDELDRALQALQQLVTLTNTSRLSPQIAIDALLLQGSFLQERLFRKGRKSDADQASICYKNVLDRHPGLVKGMTGLSYIRHFQYTILGQRGMLDEAIDLISEALAACPYPSNDIVDILIFASLCLESRAEADGCMNDVDVAIELLRLGINLQNLQGDGPALFHLLLAEKLALRYDIAEDDGDLAEAEELVRKATAEMPVSAKHEVYRNLVKGRISRIQFLKFRQKDHLLASLRSHVDGLSSIDKNSACPTYMKTPARAQLAQVLRDSYYWDHSSKLLSIAHNMAMMALAEAKSLCEDWQSFHIACEVHSILGEIQRSRYLKYAAVGILNDAVFHFRECAKLTDLRDARFAQKAANVCGILRQRLQSIHSTVFQRQLDQQEAVYWAGQLLKSTSPFRPAEKVKCVLELGFLVEDLPTGPKTVEVLDRSMSHYRLAASLEQQDFMSQVDSWRNLARALVEKGDLTRDIKYYDSGEVYLEKIEALATKRKFHSTGHLPLVARLHQARYNLTGHSVDAVGAAKAYYQIFRESNYEPSTKVFAAQRYSLLIGGLSLKNDKSTKEILETLGKSSFGALKFDDALTYAMESMLQVVSDGHDRAQQLYLIREYSLLPSICALATKVAGKDAFRIVRVYERGRSIFWDRLINRKTQIDLLEEKHSELARRYRELSKALASTEQPDPIFKLFSRDRYQAEAELAEVVKEVHQKNGFEDFLLLPLSRDEIQDYGSQGPIVFLISGTLESAGFALVITTRSVNIVDLPQFSDTACRQQDAQLGRVFASWDDTPDEMDRVLHDVLRWLWYSAAEPILSTLGFLRADSKNHHSELPRIWWITSSWINRLPIHAAGDHRLRMEHGIPVTVMDNAVSSYTPTLRALKYSRTRMEHLTRKTFIDPTARFAMLAAMQNTADRRQLDNAVPEIHEVQAIIEPELPTRLITGNELTRKTVIQNLRSCMIAHLACHGEADPYDPLRTKLLLQDWGPKPLRVGFLMRMDMANCQLAYLSACQTAVNRDEKLAEEGLHLSGAFQMAGVPNTIATSWEIHDEEAVQVAAGFYRGLKDGCGRLDVSRCARSLHGVLVDMRDRGLSPYVWGGYTHFGA